MENSQTHITRTTPIKTAPLPDPSFTFFLEALSPSGVAIWSLVVTFAASTAPSSSDDVKKNGRVVKACWRFLAVAAEALPPFDVVVVKVRNPCTPAAAPSRDDDDGKTMTARRAERRTARTFGIVLDRDNTDLLLIFVVVVGVVCKWWVRIVALCRLLPRRAVHLFSCFATSSFFKSRS